MADSFDPVAGPDARVLVLGSIPGRESIRLCQYYANPRNAFWRIMDDLFDAGPSLDYKARLEALTRRGVALWDVLASASREGTSLDSKIVRSSEVPNNIARFLDEHPLVSHVFLNGSKAEELFIRHIEPTLTLAAITVCRLPSTSPANASIPYENKLAAWQAVLHPLDCSDRFTWREGDIVLLGKAEGESRGAAK